jgi:alpha-galactosidase
MVAVRHHAGMPTNYTGRSMGRPVLAALLLLSAISATAINNGVARTPPLGWSTWETCGDEGCKHDYCNEHEVLQVADVLVSSGLRDLGWKYVNLDDCWGAMARTASGALTWDVGRFPSGIPTLAERVHARGLKLGIYDVLARRSPQNKTSGAVAASVRPHDTVLLLLTQSHA